VKDNVTQRTFTVRALIVLQFLLGLGAVISGGLFIIAPDGRPMQMPLYMLRNTPFATFLLPAMLLFTFVGIYPLIVAYSLFARPSWIRLDLLNPFKIMYRGWTASLVAGVILIIWICVQVIMFGSVSFLHVLYFVWGVAILLLTLNQRVRETYSSKHPKLA